MILLLISPVLEELSALKSKVVGYFKYPNISGKNLSKALRGKFKSSFSTVSEAGNKWILIDNFSIPQWIFINSLAAHKLAVDNNAEIQVFSFRELPFNSKQIFKSFNLNHFIRIKLNLFQFIHVYIKYIRYYRAFKEPKDLFNFSVTGIHLGIDIYESIIREGQLTVDIDSITAHRKVYLGIKQLHFMQQLIDDKKIIAMFLSHDNYLGPGLAARIAYKNRIPVFLLNTREVLCPSYDFEIYERFSKYPIYFESLSSSEKIRLLDKSKKLQKNRLSGNIDGSLPYQEKSAFKNNKTETQIQESNNSVRVLIAIHDFFDNPHAYSKMMFRDFWVWLEFLGELSIRTDYEWFIKMHRDFSEAEYEAVSLFTERYPHIKRINPNTSFHQLKSEGLTHVLTCHGTVGHELPELGINVINCAVNPHIAYEFAETYLNTDDYSARLMGLDSKDRPRGTEQLLEFYALHYYIMNANIFIYPFGNTYLEKDGVSQSLSKSLKWPIANFENILKMTLERMDELMNFKRVFSQEAVLPIEKQKKAENLDRLLWQNEGNKFPETNYEPQD
jgi:hypothetical protein